MIKSFGSQETASLFHGYTGQTCGIPQTIWKTAARKLDLLNAALKLRDLLSPPGNRLEKLRGKLEGWYSIRINDQYRVVFQFYDGNAHAVKIMDYH